jgi:hypothetical protein
LPSIIAARGGGPAARNRTSNARQSSPMATVFARRLIVLAEGRRVGRAFPAVSQWSGLQAHATDRSWMAAHRTTAAMTPGWIWTYF